MSCISRNNKQGGLVTIIRAGVVVDADQAAIVARALGAAVRVGSVEHTPAIARLIDELQSVAHDLARGVAALDGDGAVWLPAAEMATVRGVSVRTMQRWALMGKITAKRSEAGGWLVQV